MVGFYPFFKKPPQIATNAPHGCFGRLSLTFPGLRPKLPVVALTGATNAYLDSWHSLWYLTAPWMGRIVKIKLPLRT